MLFVDASGGIEKDRTLAEEVMWFCIETLMPRMKNLMVECELKKNRGRCSGLCMECRGQQRLYDPDRQSFESRCK